MWTLTGIFHHILKVVPGLLCPLVNTNDLRIYLFVTLEELTFEEVDFGVLRRVTVIQFHGHFSVSLVLGICFDGFCSGGWQLLGDGEEFVLDVEDGPFFDEGVFVEVLHEELRDDMKVVLVLDKQFFDQGKDPINIGKFKLIFFDKADHLQHLCFEHFLDAHRIFILVGI